MAGQNRHLKGDQGLITVPVHGNTVVETGDLLIGNFLANSLSTSSSADNYAYPFSYVINASSIATQLPYVIYTNFIGVAMNGSPAGVTENITVATEGVFRFPLVRTTAVTVGALVSSVSPSISSSGASKDYIAVIGDVKATTAYLGYVTKTQSGASYVDIEIRTKFNGRAS